MTFQMLCSTSTICSGTRPFALSLTLTLTFDMCLSVCLSLSSIHTQTHTLTHPHTHRQTKSTLHMFFTAPTNRLSTQPTPFHTPSHTHTHSYASTRTHTGRRSRHFGCCVLPRQTARVPTQLRTRTYGQRGVHHKVYDYY